MRARGTGTHPEGRYTKNQVFDVPEALDGSGEVHPDYQGIFDNGWAVLLAPEEDPGRTKSQIAGSIVRGDALSHPVDAELASRISEEEALAIVHTGDPDAEAEEADPHEVRGTKPAHGRTQLEPLGQGFRPGVDNWPNHGKPQASGGGNQGDTGGRHPSPPQSGGTGDRGTAASLRGTGTSGPDTGDTGGDNYASQAARDAASSAGVDASQITGTGADGKVTKADVDAYVAAQGGS